MRSPAELGHVLKAAREEKKLALSDLSMSTGLPEKYLSALERGSYEDLPGRAYARLYFLNYARALNLNTDELMLSWPQPGAVSTPRQAPPAVTDGRKRNRWIVALLLVIGLGVVWFVVGPKSSGGPSGSTTAEIVSRPEDPPEAARPDSALNQDTSELAVSSPVPPDAGATGGAIARDPLAAVDTADAPQPLRHQLRLSARAATWILVLADGDTADARLFNRGDAATFEARREFVLTVMLPGQVTVTLDDEPLILPPGGTRGLIGHRIPLNPAETGT